jgi:hypothetical protein
MAASLIECAFQNGFRHGRRLKNADLAGEIERLESDLSHLLAMIHATDRSYAVPRVLLDEAARIERG